MKTIRKKRNMPFRSVQTGILPLMFTSVCWYCIVKLRKRWMDQCSLLIPQPLLVMINPWGCLQTFPSSTRNAPLSQSQQRATTAWDGLKTTPAADFIFFIFPVIISFWYDTGQLRPGQQLLGQLLPLRRMRGRMCGVSRQLASESI